MNKAAFVFLALFASTSLGGAAQALPLYEVERIYYATAARRRVVGHELVTSCYRVERLMLSGRRTPYFRSISTPCNGDLDDFRR